MNHANDFPRGWNEERVQKVIGHHEALSEDEELSEDEAAYRDTNYTTMQVPKELVSSVRALIAQHAK